MADRTPIKTEADLCAAFIAEVSRPDPRGRREAWVAYPETGGFDIVLRRVSDGAQVGIEAKLLLNPLVVSQALPYDHGSYGTMVGPDFRAVLVPGHKVQQHMDRICGFLGVTVIAFDCDPRPYRTGPRFYPSLPERDAGLDSYTRWHPWAPQHRIELPDYIPDVIAGASSPVALTRWKIAAIRLCILLETRPVTRADFKHLGLSPTLWLKSRGWLVHTERGWTRGPKTPNLRKQHPRNYEEIRADLAKWAPKYAPSIIRLRKRKKP